jgi:hypothetical protein
MSLASWLGRSGRLATSMTRVGLWATAAALLVACQNIDAPRPTSSPALTGELARAGFAAGQEVAVAGYLLADAAGVILVETVAFEADGRPRPLDTGVAPLWLGAAAPTSLGAALRSVGDVRYAAVVARGTVDGPGSFGPSGGYKYQIILASVEPLVPQETSVEVLLDQSAAHEGQMVRLVGGLLVREDSALLVDRLGVGGLPAPKARQLKLGSPLRDSALRERLTGAPGGAVRFGQVQVEGIWRSGILAPLSITVLK